VFKAIARRLNANYVDFWSHYGRLDRVLKTPFILMNHNSIFSQHAKELRREDVRILHLIRDPRDVLISAMHYHKGTSKNGPVIDLLSMAPDVSWVRRGLVSAISGFLPPDAQVGA
jgi:hypothetical protein